MEEERIGLGVLAVMIASLAGIVIYGAGPNERSIFLIIFSITIAFSLLFFEDWFEKEGEDA